MINYSLPIAIGITINKVIMKTKQELEKIASQVRRDIVRMVHEQNSGHPGGSLGCADFMTALYFNVMECNSDNFKMTGAGEDLFFLSNGHISPVWYSVLARRGFFPVKELAEFRSYGSRLQGHPTTEKGLPGIRIASGSLGQGISAAIGAAMAKKLEKDDKLVYCLTGDGELQEGQIWEAAIFAAHHKVDNLIVTVDYNQKQIDGPMEEVMDMGNMKQKWHSFGWEVLEMRGNEMENVLSVLSDAKQKTLQGKPVIIIMKTEMGAGVDFMTGTHKWHGVAPNDDELKNALEQLPETIGDY